jgi:membrane-associated phospholipid phosphatase
MHLLTDVVAGALVGGALGGGVTLYRRRARTRVVAPPYPRERQQIRDPDAVRAAEAKRARKAERLSELAEKGVIERSGERQ